MQLERSSLIVRGKSTTEVYTGSCTNSYANMCKQDAQEFYFLRIITDKSTCDIHFVTILFSYINPIKLIWQLSLIVEV